MDGCTVSQKHLLHGLQSGVYGLRGALEGCSEDEFNGENGSQVTVRNHAHVLESVIGVIGAAFDYESQ